jgi:hypothetical protein
VDSVNKDRRLDLFCGEFRVGFDRADDVIISVTGQGTGLDIDLSRLIDLLVPLTAPLGENVCES